MHSRRVSIGDHKIRHVPNDDRACADNRMPANPDSIRDTGANSNGRAFADLHFSSHRNARSHACEIMQRTFVIDQSARIDDAELPYPRCRSNMRLSENRGASPNLRGCRYYGRGVFDHRELHARNSAYQVEIDFSSPPIVPNCDDQMIDRLSRADTCGLCEIAEYGIAPLLRPRWRRIVQIAGYAIFSSKLDRIEQNGSMP